MAQPEVKNKVGRPCRYLTTQQFQTFLNQDFYHLKLYSKASFWISLTILGAIVANYIMG